MVRKYKKEHNLDTQWNFGQALPVLLTLAPVFALVDAIWTLFKTMNNDTKERHGFTSISGRLVPVNRNKSSDTSHIALAQQFSATLFLALWCSPFIRKELLSTWGMTSGDLKVLEGLVCEAYERWDIAVRPVIPFLRHDRALTPNLQGRTGDLDDAWDVTDTDDEDDRAKFNSIYVRWLRYSVCNFT